MPPAILLLYKIRIMKKALGTAIIASLLLAACNKKDDTTTPTNNTTPTTTTIPTDGWKMNNIKYTQVYCLRQENQFLLNCVDGSSPVNSFAAHFHAYPTASGTYHIVTLVVDSSAAYPGQNIGANDVIISGAIPNGASGYKTYWSTGVEGKDATVTISGGKMKIEVPEVAIQYNGDTVKITGTMIEN